MPGPLSGIRVVDLTLMVLGPVATQILGDMGAEVIKVEPPGGDPMRYTGPARSEGMSAMYMTMNRNKRSIVLDLKKPGDSANFLRIVDKSDVVVHNMRPSAAQRLGISYDALSERNPRVIVACAPGFRQDGPYAARPAYDDIIQGMSGLAGMNLRAGGQARFMPTALCDKLVGYVLASSIGMALFARERSGQGQEVVVPMFETMVAFNMLDHLYGGTFEQTAEAIGYPRLLSPHRHPYSTKDGYVCVMAHTDEQWRRLFGAIGRPELAEDESYAKVGPRTTNIRYLQILKGECMATRTTAEWRAALDKADVPNGPMHRLEDLFNDEQLKQTGFFQPWAHPTEGPIVMAAVSVGFSATPAETRAGPPRLDQDHDSIAREFGFSPETEQ
jgi:crotonobetainyl-CoA:carnitine CoA-transferase CaiB-like acyl-CoA transferase